MTNIECNHDGEVHWVPCKCTATHPRCALCGKQLTHCLSAEEQQRRLNRLNDPEDEEPQKTPKPMSKKWLVIGICLAGVGLLLQGISIGIRLAGQ